MSCVVLRLWRPKLPCADHGLVVSDPVADLKFHHLFLAAGQIKFERAVQRVGRLLIVIEHEVSPDGGDSVRELHT